MPSDFFSYSQLATLPGAMALVYLVVEYSADYLPAGLPTPIYAWFIGVVTLITAQLAGGADGHDWRVYPLALANAVLVALAAGKLHDLAKAKGLPAPLLPDLLAASVAQTAPKPAAATPTPSPMENVTSDAGETPPAPEKSAPAATPQQAATP